MLKVGCNGYLLIGLCSALGVFGCAASGAGERPDGVISDNNNNNNGAGGGALLGNGTGGAQLGNVMQAGNPDGGRETKVDDAGNKTCINIASFGKPGGYGAEGMDTTAAFENWLNTKSSAKASMITTHETLTAALLSNYDVIILQDLEDGSKGSGPFWTFSDAEVSAVAKWVQDGGGLITLMGYSGSKDEVKPTNQLLKFANIQYNTDDIFVTGDCPAGMDCYCVGDSVPLTGWTAGDAIAANITQVGAFYGRSLNAPDATVVAGKGDVKYGVSKAVGKGHVFAFADEWVTYTSQWGAPLARNTDMYNSCYMKGADKLYQVPQFWYNAIKWASSNIACFDIEDPGIVK